MKPSISPSNPKHLGFDPQKLRSIDTMMDCYVTAGKTAGMLTLVSRHGEVVHRASHGFLNIAAQTSMAADSLFRIYSMTKPITSVALMTLLEQGKLHIDDPVAHWMPAIKSLRVCRSDGKTEPLQGDITIRHLLTHTAGFSYGFEPEIHFIDKMYQDRWRSLTTKTTLAELLQQMFEVPLIAQPGSHWHYSIATDICGYLIELITQMKLGDYLSKTIFEPLGMIDTAFDVSTDKRHRLATIYGEGDDHTLVPVQVPLTTPYGQPTNIHFGGAGLYSTAPDYLRFAQMMLNGGTLDGARIISRKTVEWMTMNHLTEKLLPISNNGIVPQLSNAYGFGLGYCINIDPAKAGTLGSTGDFGWGGMADTYCWIDPKEGLIGILMQQYLPSMQHAGRRDFRNAVYQALI